MHRGRHDVTCGECALHHVRVYRIRIAAMIAVQLARPLVRRKNQPSGAAGVVRNVIALQRLRVAPIQVFGYGQMRRENSALRPRVVGSQRLPIRDQPLKHDASHVVLPHGIPNGSRRADRGREYLIDEKRRNGCQQLHGNMEDRPVVDRKDILPLPGYRILVEPPIIRLFVPQPIEVPNPLVAREILVIRQRVDDDRRAHLRSLIPGRMVGLLLLNLFLRLGRPTERSRPWLQKLFP